LRVEGEAGLGFRVKGDAVEGEEQEGDESRVDDRALVDRCAVQHLPQSQSESRIGSRQIFMIFF